MSITITNIPFKTQKTEFERADFVKEFWEYLEDKRDLQDVKNVMDSNQKIHDFESHLSRINMKSGNTK